MNHLVIPILIYLSLILESSVLPDLVAADLQPNLFWLCALFAMLRLGPNSSLVWSGIAGLVAATVSGVPAGIEVISFSVACFLWRRLEWHEVQSVLLIAILSAITFSVFSLVGQIAMNMTAGKPFTVEPAWFTTAGMTTLFGLVLQVCLRGGRKMFASFLPSSSASSQTGRWKPFVNS